MVQIWACDPIRLPKEIVFLKLLGKRLVFLLLPSCCLGKLQADANTAGKQSQEGKRNRVTMMMFEY